MASQAVCSLGSRVQEWKTCDVVGDRMQSGSIGDVELLREAPNAIEDAYSGGIGKTCGGSDVAARHVWFIVGRRFQ